MKIFFKLYLFLFFFASTPVIYSISRDVNILSSSSTVLELEFTPQNWKSQTLEINNQNFEHFSFYLSEPFGDPGLPEIPARGVLVGVPPQGPVHLQIIQTEETLHNNIQINPIPHTKINPKTDKFKYIIDEKYYLADQPYPKNIVELDGPFWFRNQRVVRIIFKPLQFSGQKKQVRQFKTIKLNIRFSPSQSANPILPITKDEHLYKNALINYNTSRKWRVYNDKLRKITKNTFQGNNWYKIIIQADNKQSKEGIYKIDGQTLAAAGIPISTLDPSTIQLFNNGGRELPRQATHTRADSLIENPITIIGTQDGSFDQNDYILFYGRAVQGIDYNPKIDRLYHYINHYTDDNVYWLTFGVEKGKRIPTIKSLPTGNLNPEPSFRTLEYQELERHNIFNSGYHWFGQQLAKDRNTFSYTFNLNHAKIQDSVTVQTRLVSASAGNHQFKISLNGFELGTRYLGSAHESFIFGDFTFKNQGILVNGENTLTIEYLTSTNVSVAYVDWVEIHFNQQFIAENNQLIFNAPIQFGDAAYNITGLDPNDLYVFDVTDIANIRQINQFIATPNAITFADSTRFDQPKRYIAANSSAFKSVTLIEKDNDLSNLRSSKSVEYIIITHDDFFQHALQLASIRENLDPDNRLETEVVKISNVFDEFSWGLFDPTAIRDFLMYAQVQWDNPQYVLLVGDGHFDYKNILGYQTRNLIPPYESTDRYETYSRTTDDWFTYTKGEDAGMQMAIGRLPVQSAVQAQYMIDKIIQYETNPQFGEWRKIITIVGDDELAKGGTGNEPEHTYQAESLAENHVPDVFNVKKIYLIEYPAVRTASVSGITKPTATEDLIRQINNGSLIINYIGHGNDELWSHERVLNAPTDFQRIQNTDRLALWIAATCEFAYWDQPQKQSFAERILNAQDRGAIGMVSSARLAFSSENAAFNYKLYDQLFRDYPESGLVQRIGDATMLAKLATPNRTNNEKYNVFGDPTMRLAAPKFSAVINDIQPDTLQALRKMRVTGHVEQNNTLWSQFNGKILLRIIDSRKKHVYETEFGSKIQYYKSGNSIFRGVAPVRNGTFHVDFIVPKDISYGGDEGQISAYFWNNQVDGTGNQNHLPVGGTATDLIDRLGPEINIHFGNKAFAPGDYTTTNPTLYVEAKDSLSGINIAGGIGHQITLTLDHDQAKTQNITETFQYDEGSYTKGTARYQLFDLAEGRHDLQIKVWDNSNNSSILESHFVVVADSVLKIRELLNYPNPMTDKTTFTFHISQQAETSLKIYSINGRLLKSFEPALTDIGFNVFPEIWDGTDQQGDKLANGVYLYKLKAKSYWDEKTSHAEKIGKLIIAR